MKWAAIRVIEVVPIQVRRGDVQGARHAFDVAKERADSRNYETRTRLGSIEVELLSAEGRHAEALAVAQQLLDALPKLGLPDVGVKRVIAHGVAAALELGELEAADAMLAIVRQARPGVVSCELRGHVAHLDARLSALRGNHDAAEAGFETASPCSAISVCRSNRGNLPTSSLNRSMGRDVRTRQRPWHWRRARCLNDLGRNRGWNGFDH